MNTPAALRGVRARPWASLALAGLLTLIAAGTAKADITGTVATPIGVRVGDVRVEVNDASGNFVDSEYTNAAVVFTIPTSSLGSSTGPYTLKTSKYDNCPERPYTEANRQATAGPVADGAPGAPGVANLVLDIYDVCAGSSGSGPEATGIVDAVARRALVPPGGIVYLRVLAPRSARNFQVHLVDGIPTG